MNQTEVVAALQGHLTAFKATEFGFDHEAYEEESAQRLRPLPEAQRFALICSVFLPNNPLIGMRVAERCLEQTEYFEHIIRYGLPKAGSAQVGFWMRHGIAHLGTGGMIGVVFELLASDPDLLDLAVYDLKWVLPSEDSEARNMLERLQAEYSVTRS